MKNISLPPQYSKSCTCEVCERLITYYDYLQIKELDYIVCGSFDCKKIMNQKSQIPPVQFNNYFQHQKRLLLKLREDAEIKNKYSEKVVKYEKSKHLEILQTVLDNNSQITEKDVHLVKIPSGLTKISAPAKERIKNYSEHLNRIIDEAIEKLNNDIVIPDPNESAKDRLELLEQQFSENPRLEIMADRLCTMCKGGCCPSGNDHAYISSFTIMQIIKANPKLSHDDIHEFYLSKVPSKTVEGACINQTEQGCSLPRDMRSNTCNGYHCGPVKAFINEEAEKDVDKPATVIAVQWSNTNWNWLDPKIENEIVGVALIDEP